jgi:hypothetical protein
MPLKGEGKHEKVRRSRPSPGIIASDSSAAQQFVRRGGRQTPNHTLQRTAASRSCSNPRVSWAGSLSLGWPERCKALVSVSGYLIGSQEAGKVPLPPKNELEWWYQYYFATERGRAGYDKYRHDFAKLIWQIASPKWSFDDATFDRSAASFNNPDHVSIVIHNYRWRLGLAEGEPKYDDLEKRLAEGPVITVPTITLEGDANGAPHPDGSSYAKKFSGKYAHRIIKGASGTICLKKPRRPLPKLSSKSTVIDRRKSRPRNLGWVQSLFDETRRENEGEIHR